ILSHTEAVKILGVLMTFAGVSFAIWARVHLGQYWSGRITVKTDHELIRSGPYAITRHPIYTGFIFGILGCAVTSGEVKGLIAFIIIVFAFFRKIRLEEKILYETFGKTYEEYSKQVAALIPYLA